MAEAGITELIADGGWGEINRVLAAITATWKWTDEGLTTTGTGRVRLRSQRKRSGRGIWAA